MTVDPLTHDEFVRLERIAARAVAHPETAMDEYLVQMDPLTILRLCQLVHATAHAVAKDVMGQAISNIEKAVAAKRAGKDDGDGCAACVLGRRDPIHSNMQLIDYHPFKRRPR